MGRDAQIDPAMAAMLAARAAEAAAAAAAAAAAEQAAKDASLETATARSIAPETTIADNITSLGRLDGLGDGDGTPTVDETGRRILGDTGVTLGTVVDGSPLDGLTDRDPTALVGDQGPAGSSMLPGLDTSSLAGLTDRAGLADMSDRFNLDGGAADRPAMGKDMLQSDPLGDAIKSVPFYNDAGTPDAGTPDGGADAGGPVYEWAGSLGHPSWVAPDGEVVDKLPDGGVDSRSLPGHETTATAKTHLDDIDGSSWSIGGWLSRLLGGSDAGTTTDGGTDGGTTTDGGTDGGTPSAEYKTEDQAGTTRPPGWIDTDDILGGRLGIDGAVYGSRGGNPSGGGDSTDPTDPQGGDTTVNPGSEGSYGTGTSHMSDRGAYTGGAIGMVGQSAGPDVDEPKVALTGLPSIQPGPGPEVINPGTGEQADADAQASTAASSTSDPTMPGYDGNGGLPADDPMAAMPAEDADTGDSLSESSEHGRSFGQGHAHGSGDAHAADPGHGADLSDEAAG